jgi:hypothetical protein
MRVLVKLRLRRDPEKPTDCSRRRSNRVELWGELRVSRQKLKDVIERAKLEPFLAHENEANEPLETHGIGAPRVLGRRRRGRDLTRGSEGSEPFS